MTVEGSLFTVSYNSYLRWKKFGTTLSNLIFSAADFSEGNSDGEFRLELSTSGIYFSANDGTLNIRNSVFSRLSRSALKVEGKNIGVNIALVSVRDIGKSNHDGRHWYRLMCFLTPR